MLTEKVVPLFPPVEQACSKCCRTLAVTAFRRTGAGYEKVCRECRRVAQKTYRARLVINGDIRFYEKKCTGCDLVKPLSNFNKNRSVAGGYNQRCQICTRSYHTVAERKRRTKGGVHRRSRLLRLYGITLEEYQAIIVTQGGGCAICRKPQDEKRWHAVDHDGRLARNKAAIRGILCIGCNRGLGQFGDNPTLLRLAAEYLEKFQARDGD